MHKKADLQEAEMKKKAALSQGPHFNVIKIS